MVELVNEFGTKIKGAFVLITSRINGYIYSLVFINGNMVVCLKESEVGERDIITELTDDIIDNLENEFIFNPYLTNIELGLNPENLLNMTLLENFLFYSSSNYDNYYYINKELSTTNKIHLYSTQYSLTYEDFNKYINETQNKNEDVFKFPNNIKIYKNMYIKQNGQIVSAEEIPNAIGVLEVPLSYFCDDNGKTKKTILDYAIMPISEDIDSVWFSQNRYGHIKNKNNTSVQTVVMSIDTYYIYAQNNPIEINYYALSYISVLKSVMRHYEVSDLKLQFNIPLYYDFKEVDFIKKSNIYNVGMYYETIDTVQIQNKAVFIRRLRNAHNFNLKKLKSKNRKEK